MCPQHLLQVVLILKLLITSDEYIIYETVFSFSQDEVKANFGSSYDGKMKILDEFLGDCLFLAGDNVSTE